MAANTSDLDQIFDPRFSREMNVAQRIHLGMTLADYVQKQPKKDGMKYTFVSHDSVTALIRDVCQKVGLIFYPVEDSAQFTIDGNRVNLKLAVRFENIDNREDTVDVLGIGFGIDPGDKGPGKAISYAVKYALLKAFGLETGDDPDQDQNVQHRSSTAQRADEQMKSIIVTTDESEFRAIVTSEATRQIMASLEAQAPAEWRMFRQGISQHAKALGVDMKSWANDPA